MSDEERWTGPDGDWSEGDEALLSRLLCESGSRRPLATDLEEVRPRVVVAWRTRTDRARRRRRAAVGLGVAAATAMGIGLLLWSNWRLDSRAPLSLGTLEARWGAVRIEGGDRRAGTVLAGTEIVTADGRASLRLGTGELVRLDRGTHLTVDGPARVRLAQGAVYVDSGSLPRGSTDLVVATERGNVREVGTQFEVRLQGAELTVRVREGQVAVSRDGREHVARKGEEVLVAGDGSVRRAVIPGHGPAWEWVLASAPPMKIEGESMLAFLRWAAREGGWNLSFAEEHLRDASARVVLHGSISGLNPREGLDVVIAGSGLDYRLEEGHLIIVAARNPND